MTVMDFFSPLLEFGFMRRAWVGCLALSLGGTPVGVFMLLRRMSLVGDAMSHAILPGAALGYLAFGLSLPAMATGGFVAGLLVALLAGAVTRGGELKEDANLAAFYLISLALGVLMISLRGRNMDLLEILFGSALALDDEALLLTSCVCTVTLVFLAMMFRPLVMECADPQFFRSVSRLSPVAHYGVLFMVVINLVAGFHAIGTLMAVGLMILPAIAARLWTRNLTVLFPLASFIAFLCSLIGLLCSYHADVPAGPAIILAAGLAYVSSLLFAPYGVLRHKLPVRSHLES